MPQPGDRLGARGPLLLLDDHDREAHDYGGAVIHHDPDEHVDRVNYERTALNYHEFDSTDLDHPPGPVVIHLHIDDDGNVCTADGSVIHRPAHVPDFAALFRHAGPDCGA